MKNIYIIVGLGNPDKLYENTYHNMGFKVIDKLAENKNLSFSFKSKFNAKVAEFEKDDSKIVLVKPETYMNASGTAVVAVKNFYKVDNKHIIVVYDDIDLKVGDVRLREKGSAGTHNGMRDIVEKLSASDFPRLRIGVGRNPNIKNLADFVLSNVTKKDMDILENSFETAMSMLDKFIELNGNVAEVLNWMNKNK